MDSRIEEILKEKVGDPYEEVPLMSRIEILLDRLGSGSGDSSAYAHSLELAINSQTYVLTATLKNTSGETLGTPQTIDLPLETMVVGGSYDDTTKKVILTLKNGNTVDFSVADLVDGFLTEEEYNAGKTVSAGTQYTIGGTTYTVGNNAEVFNDYSNNKAIGDYSHAEGVATTASGIFSHTEGSFTIASGESSHAEGTGTIAASNRQHVQGEFNIEDSNNKFAFIIGNGATDKRSNAFAIDWNGNIYVNNSETGVNVSQLQPIINSSNKLSADFVDDSDSPNKFVTSDEKTKISNNNNALVELIDSGQKNLVNAQNPSGQQRVTITKGNNGSAVISCSNATWATTAYHVYVTPNEDYKLLLYVDEADVSNVTFRCFTSAVDDDGAELEVLPRTERITETGVYTLDINTQYNRIKISTNINNSATAGSGSATIRMMLCSKAAWDISQKYVPYRPSYDELVARITALENA